MTSLTTAVPGLNAISVTRGLWVFNALIAVQTVMDLTILVGGAALPDGMSYAEYAHRGAYPLLATALLAGAFALAARPFLASGRWLKPLLLVWLAQNVVLCGTAFLRLDLYVEVYGLTYLRIYAMIWMALVAGGLILTAAQVVFGKSNAWLLMGATSLGLATLYTASFINFASHIARHNLTLPDPDLAYLCRLGPMAGIAWAKPDPTVSVRPMPCFVEPPRIDAWPEWGLRKARIARYEFPPVPEDTGQ